MTTQELKQYIDKVLGNGIRCLLPSYWWKRLFNQVADRIDEVEQSASELIEASKMPIVESVDELNKLDLPNGSVAAVKAVGEPKVINPADCYNTSVSTIQQNWDKLTIIKAIEYKDNVPKEWVDIVYMTTYNGGENNQVVVGQVDGGLLCVQGIDGEKHRISLQKVNELLASEEYRIFVCNPENSELAFTLYSEIPHPELYIKGNSWERLAKESDLEGIEGGGSPSNSSSGAEIRELYVGDSITDEHKAWNLKTKELVEQNKCTTIHRLTKQLGILPIGCVIPQSAYKDGDFNYIFSTGCNSAIVTIKVDAEGYCKLSSAVVTTDSSFSDTSENAVQNKVVTAAFDHVEKVYVGLAEYIRTLSNDEEIIAAALNDLNERLNNAGGGNSSGSGVVTFCIPHGETATDEEIAKNKAAYDAFIATNGGVYIFVKLAQFTLIPSCFQVDSDLIRIEIMSSVFSEDGSVMSLFFGVASDGSITML